MGTTLFVGISHSQSNDDVHSACSVIYGAAEAIMLRRQNNEPLPDVIGLAKKTGEYQVFIEALVVDAYNLPLEKTNSDKQRAIRSFANDSYLTCIDPTPESE